MITNLKDFKKRIIKENAEAKVAGKVMDMIGKTYPNDITSQEMDAIANYFNDCLDKKDCKYGTAAYYENQPHAAKVKAAIDSFFATVLEKYPELASKEKEIKSTYNDYWFGLRKIA